MYKLTNYNVIYEKTDPENIFQLNIQNEKIVLYFKCENMVEKHKWIEYFN